MLRALGLRVIVGLLLVLCLAALAEARVWTSRDGAFSIEAELVDFQGGKVSLKRADGKVVAVALEKLSLADTLYVQKALQALGRDLRAEQEKLAPKPMPVPEVPAPMPKPEEPLVTPVPAPKPMISVIPVEPESTQPEVLPDDEKGPPTAKPDVAKWQVGVDPPLQPLVLAANQQVAIPMPGKGLVAIYPHALSPFVLLGGLSNTHPRRVFDLRTGAKIGELPEVVTQHDLITLSPDGQHIACQTVLGHGSLGIWSVSSGKLQRKLMLPAQHATPMFLSFAGNHRLLGVVRGEAKLMIWSLQSGKLTQNIPLPTSMRESGIAVSPGGHYVAIASGNQVDFYDLRNEAIAGTIDVPVEQRSEPIRSIAFSDDGREFAVTRGGGVRECNELMCWSLHDCKLVVSHKLSDRYSLSQYHGKGLEWFPDQSGWLVMGSAVVSRTTGGPIWVAGEQPFTLPTTTVRLVDKDRMLVVSDRDEPKLVLANIPKEKFAQGAKFVAAGGRIQDSNLPPTTKVDIRTARVIDREAEVAYSYQARPMKLPANVDISKPWELGRYIRQIHLGGPQAGRVVLNWRESNQAQPKQFCEVYNLATRQAEGSFEVPFRTQLKAVSPDGQRGAFLMEIAQDRVDLFELTSGRPLGGFRPYEQVQSTNFTEKQVKWLGYASEQCLLTMNNAGLLAAWELPSFQPLYTVALGSGARATLDGSRQIVALNGPAKTLTLLEAATGTIVGKLEAAGVPASQQVTASAFRADGAALAVTFTGDKGITLVQWDLTNGKVQQTIPLPLPTSALTWVGPQHVLLHMTRRFVDARTPDLKKMYQCSLVDLERQSVVWTYQHPSGGMNAESPGDLHWYTAASDFNKPSKLFAMSLPDPEATKHIAAVGKVKPLLDTGSEMALSVEVEGKFPVSSDDQESRPVQLKNEVAAQLRETLAAQKINVVPEASSRLHVKLSEQSELAAAETRAKYNLRTSVFAASPAIVIQIELRSAAGTLAWHTGQVIGERELGPIDLRRRPEKMTPSEYLREEQWKAAIGWTRLLTLPVPLYEFSTFEGLGETHLTLGGPKTAREPPAAPAAPPQPAPKDKQT